MAFEVATALYRDGRYNQSQYLVWNVLEPQFWNEGRTVLYQNVWELGYPRAFSEEVEAAAAEFGLEPNIIYSVMREESRFRQEVVSWAGAHGLMQMIMPTAKAVARQMPLANFDKRMLYQPRINIKMGSWYLKSLIADFGGNVYYSLGGYNGGPHNIKRWLNEKKEMELDEFLEDIPYNETRYYVKKVMRSYLRYRYIYPLPGQTRLVEAPVIFPIGN